MESFTVFGYRVSFLDAFILLCTAGYGLYSIYTGVRLKKEKRFFRNSLLIPNGRMPEDCIDPPGYIQALTPKLLVFGTLLILLGVFSFILPLITEGVPRSYFVGLIGIVPVLILLLTFNGILKRTYNAFWP